MFDRILQIIDKCSSTKFDRKTVDDTVMVYFRQGAPEAQKHLLAAQVPAADASELLYCIEKENHRLNRQATLINAIFFGLMFGIFFISILFKYYVSMVLFGSAAALWLLALVRSISRQINAKRFFYQPNGGMPGA